MGVVAAAAAAAAVSVRSLLCASNTAASAGLLSPLPVSRHGGGGDVGRLQPALRLRHRRFFALQAAAPWVCRSIASSSDTALLLSSADSSDEQDISNDEEEDDEGDGEANDDDSDYDDSQDEAAKAVLKCQAAGDKKQQALKMALRRNERKKKPRACEFIVAAMDSPGLEEYGTLARLYAHKRLHMAAARLPKMMHDRGITPNRDVYYHCLRACARAARPAAAAALLQDMLHERMVVGAREYNTLLRAASRTDDYSILTQALAADTWLLLMSGRGHPVHELIGGCQAVSRVMPWWEKMWQQGTTFPKPNLESYCVMIVAYGFDGHTKLAERMFNRMIMAGIKPNRRAMFALIEAQTLAGNLAGAFAAWEYGISIRSVVPLPQVVSQRDGILKWDLHGFTPFAACIALLKGLLRLHANLQDPTGRTASIQEIHIIVGRGLRSEKRLQPTLKTAIVRLVDFLQPRLEYKIYANNDGCLVVKSGSLGRWAQTEGLPAHISQLEQASTPVTQQLNQKEEALSKLDPAFAVFLLPPSLLKPQKKGNRILQLVNLPECS